MELFGMKFTLFGNMKVLFVCMKFGMLNYNMYLLQLHMKGYVFTRVCTIFFDSPLFWKFYIACFEPKSNHPKDKCFWNLNNIDNKLEGK